MESIWRYTAKHWSAELADHYIHMLVAAMEKAAQGTVAGIRVDCLPEYWKIPAGKHVVYFKGNGSARNRMDVIRILHGRMDVSRHL